MAFDLASVLKSVPGSDTDREQIQYIPLSQLDGDVHNFYHLGGVEDLAANIATVGLQQPIRVRVNPASPGRYLIVSGHRRRAALEMLQADDPEKWAEAPCIVEAASASPALQQLRLIYANANTRTLTAAEISEQAVQVERLLYQLKEEGYAFPGRMRDHVAQAVGASKSKLARLKVIRDNLIREWDDLFKADEIGESVAYALAGIPPEWQLIIWTGWRKKPGRLYESCVKAFVPRFQRISQQVCPETGTPCMHDTQMMIISSRDQYMDPCRSCCRDCVHLCFCKSPCSHASAKKKELLAAARQAKDDAARCEAERRAPLDLAIGAAAQIGQAREAANVPDPDTWHAGTPPTPGRYVVILSGPYIEPVADDGYWSDSGWELWGAPIDEDEIHVDLWQPFPAASLAASGVSCKTGISPNGHCSSAAFCDHNADCCLNCDDDACNARCGWIDGEEAGDDA